MAIEIQPRTGERSDLTQAEKIFGKDFLGPDAIDRTFGIKMSPDQIPPIPFDRERLRVAEKRNQFLILRTDKAPEGSPLTMAKMEELWQDDDPGQKVRLKKKGPQFIHGEDNSVLLMSQGRWFNGITSFTEQTPRPKWALVSKDFVPGSKNDYYFEQMDKTVNYIKGSLFQNQDMPSEYKDAIAEYEQEREEIKKFSPKHFNPAEVDQLMDWRKGIEALNSLKLNEIARHTPSEALYDLLTYFKVNGKRLFLNQSFNTSTFGSPKDLQRLVNIGFTSWYNYAIELSFFTINSTSPRTGSVLSLTV